MKNITRIKFTVFFIGLCIFISPVFAQTKSDLKVSDYLKILPAEYKTFFGDFQMEPTDETTLIDDKNGYAAYYSQPIKNKNAFPIFEIGILKKASGEQILVVSNTFTDPICTDHETFFLQKSGENWINVKSKILPELTAPMFFDSPKTATDYLAELKKFDYPIDLNLHFPPPRKKGTRIKVTLEICKSELAAEAPKELNFQKFIDKSKPVWLTWNKERGVFYLK